MLARPRRSIRAGCPRTSRRCTFGTVSRSASHAVFAPDLAIASAVITRPPPGASCATPVRAPPPATATLTRTMPARKKREGRGTPRPPSPRSAIRPSVHDGIGHDVFHRVHWLVVHPHLVVQVRSRGESGRADFRDHL